MVNLERSIETKQPVTITLPHKHKMKLIVLPIKPVSYPVYNYYCVECGIDGYIMKKMMHELLKGAPFPRMYRRPVNAR